ncbi:cell division protein ZipA C-terminal FtsZ-binding domain-containing protein [Niveibacterium sp. 24ML]|uniref:cell division protein ZipA C-terminal FtsZ-binding domain-containing protein n=1 Tax=Niveibacterium sp. 24ML TaxID=2985512 RepID=UPI002271EC81|nr:cell division protein ZipA C-terminal FtsZ-binding domain-containing protein [Niveibacterium sp. 24ML]MCX9156547.1 cell division protein ZipA C-terminal FtsZ-binding domain-containing protein [Niveibacterium sp. 24ML]
MAGNELLYGLIGSGAGIVVLVVGYNAWQERKARRNAEKAFRSEHRDVLLEGAGAGADMEPGERKEPASARIPQQAPIGRAAEPELAVEARAIDAVAHIEAPAGVVGGALVQGAGGPLSQVHRAVRWFGFDDGAHDWVPLDAADKRSFTRVCAAMQLADRRGPVSERELDAFTSAIQRVCDQFMAVPRFMERSEALSLAQGVDQFCAALDIQIAVNVVAGPQPFAGTKLRGLTEAAGLRLEADGCFHARDDAGLSQFVLANSDASMFSADTLRSASISGVTLSLDVPRVSAGVQVFDKMIALSRQIAAAMQGQLVDDNGKPLNEASLGMIRSQIQQFQEQMHGQGVAPGSPLALRLFV